MVAAIIVVVVVVFPSRCLLCARSRSFALSLSLSPPPPFVCRTIQFVISRLGTVSSTRIWPSSISFVRTVCRAVHWLRCHCCFSCAAVISQVVRFALRSLHSAALFYPPPSPCCPLCVRSPSISIHIYVYVYYISCCSVLLLVLVMFAVVFHRLAACLI